jgi:hypothetical protein
VALALQNTPGGLVASLSIVLDKPFVMGDFLIVDQRPGTIKHIGSKTIGSFKALQLDKTFYREHSVAKRCPPVTVDGRHRTEAARRPGKPADGVYPEQRATGS